MMFRHFIKARNKSGNDAMLQAVLRHFDPVAEPDSDELALVESRIMAQIMDTPKILPAAEFTVPFWQGGRNWAMRACALAVLFIMLGFVTGRNFDLLTSQSGEPETLFASADGSSPWQSFITAPAVGEADDANE
jgi:hypothetical protein